MSTAGTVRGIRAVTAAGAVRAFRAVRAVTAILTVTVTVPAATALVALTTSPAYAHGAPTDPVSRVAACGSQGQLARTDACRAAVAANGGRGFEEFDNLRVAGVNGRDREVIPDGRLCSGGLDAYKGLDVARADWPATRLRAGDAFTLTYVSTIPHEGTFSLYLTTEGYDPTAPLTWADLAPQPFLTVDNPPLDDGAYRVSGTLPTGLTGRHMLYTIWRNTSTPDTYYSCSDVVFDGAGAGSDDGNASAGAGGTGNGAGTGAGTGAGGAGNGLGGGVGNSAAVTGTVSPRPDASVTASPAASAPPSVPETDGPGNTASGSSAEAAAPQADATPTSPQQATPSFPVAAGTQLDYVAIAAGGALVAAGIAVFASRRRRAAAAVGPSRKHRP
ncbi:hypothetical protein GCM10009654_02550 [Streptomyces hebeiensis]|uniref:Chitin-binding type-4 domain-containing protein n=1 Tax=Streptomyces hebeiensis TaxID=229486 RepID=A0ABN1UHA2_9ACTN